MNETPETPMTERGETVGPASASSGGLYRSSRDAAEAGDGQGGGGPDAWGIKTSWHFAMPSADTFSVPPIRSFVQRYLTASTVTVDPFARNNRWATYTNDLNPETTAEFNMDAEDFCRLLRDRGVVADLVLFDPPYSPRQVSECYNNVGRVVGMKETQTALLYKRVRYAIHDIVAPGGVVLTFGWNSTGMTQGLGYVKEEIMLVNHGGAHNDTICIAERKVQHTLFGPESAGNPGHRHDAPPMRAAV